MTYQQKYRENKRHIKNYADFLSLCDTLNDTVKLSMEIARLADQNKQIDQMPYEDTKRDINDYTIQTNALL